MFKHFEEDSGDKEFKNAIRKEAPMLGKYSDGGEVEPKPVIEDSTLKGFAMLMRKASGMDDAPQGSSDTAKGYAGGGQIPDADQTAALLSGQIPGSQSGLMGPTSISPMPPAPPMPTGNPIMNALRSLSAPAQAVGQATQAVTNSSIPMAAMQAMGNAIPNPMAPGIAKGAANAVATPPQGAPNMGEGPNVGNAQNGMSPTPAPAPQTPPMAQTMQNLNKTPNTPPSIYKGITAEDRAKLYKQLLDKQNSGGGLAAQAAGGIGDAISNSFGKGGSHAAEDVRSMGEKNIENRVGAMDTQRQQKLQDMQASIAQQEADPNSVYSQGMRQFFKGQGINVPGGMSAGMLKGMLPDLAKIFGDKLTATTAAGQQGVEAGKVLTDQGLMSRMVGHWLGNSGEDYLEKRIGSNGPTPPASNTAGWSVKR